MPTPNFCGRAPMRTELLLAKCRKVTDLTREERTTIDTAASDFAAIGKLSAVQRKALQEILRPRHMLYPTMPGRKKAAAVPPAGGKEAFDPRKVILELLKKDSLSEGDVERLQRLLCAVELFQGITAADKDFVAHLGVRFGALPKAVPVAYLCDAGSPFSTRPGPVSPLRYAQVPAYGGSMPRPAPIRRTA